MAEITPSKIILKVERLLNPNSSNLFDKVINNTNTTK
jgi:hypothetical protein